MKLLADVNVSRRVVVLLREAGLDMRRVSEVLDARAADVDIVAEAARLGAILISHDQDFSAILAASGATKPSLINLHVSYVDASRLADAVAAVLVAVRADLDAGAIVTVDDCGIRVHRLPIG